MIEKDGMAIVGRRLAGRHSANLPVTVTYKDGAKGSVSVPGLTLTLQDSGISFQLESPVAESAKYIIAEIQVDGRVIKCAGHIRWMKHASKKCGMEFDPMSQDWKAYMDSIDSFSSEERRQRNRRESFQNVNENRRNKERRYSELLKDSNLVDENIESPKVKSFLRSKSTTFTSETIQERRDWVSKLTSTEIQHIGCFSEDVSEFKGKVENPIGVAHVPLGIAGPLRINGNHAKGVYFLPLATTEGALVTSYTLGSHIITRSGGANVKLLKNELRIGPMFVFKKMSEAATFIKWINSNFTRIQEIAQQTSAHLKLNEISTILNGRRVIANFHYVTGDAMGMNMACKATDTACRMIRQSVHPEEFWLRSNYNSNKKVTASNYVNGYGRTLTADVIIPRRLVSMLSTTPEQMERYFFRTLLSDVQAGMIGANGHFANAIAALYIACGQDVGLVANSHVGISTCETTKDGNLYFSAYLSNVLVGTVGGGTSFGTAKECLSMLDCVGTGKADKFAEIVAASALAGEIAICASIVNGTYVFAHETFGRNRPK